MLNLTHFTCVLAVLLSGLSAGLFYSYSCSVNPGLGALNDIGYLKAMQSINKAILNPVFFASFLGSLLMMAVATALTYKTGQLPAFYYWLAAFLVYLIGVFGVTAFGNVPLNEALAGLSIDAASASQLQEYRSSFELPWNKYHSIRTVAVIISFLLTIIAIRK